MQVSLRITIAKTAKKADIDADPVNTIDKLKKEMENKITPAFISYLEKQKNWRVLNKYIRDKIYIKPSGSPKERCGSPGEAQEDNARRFTEKCGNVFFQASLFVAIRHFICIY